MLTMILMIVGTMLIDFDANHDLMIMVTISVHDFDDHVDDNNEYSLKLECNIRYR